MEPLNPNSFVRSNRRKRLPPGVDLREWGGPVHFQGGFNTCAAHAGASLVSYFEKRIKGTDVAASRLFLYKVAKTFLLVGSPDSGVYLRQVMGVIKLIGVPPEQDWPYPDPGTPAQPRFSDCLFDTEPTPECFAAASNYRALNYSLEDVDQKPEDLLRLAKAHLAAHIPFAFDFPVYPSMARAQKSGQIPFPAADETVLTNHAVVAMGYDDGLEIGAGIEGAVKTRGALLIKNSWSEQWGETGYGWLPYEFVLQCRTRDFWTLSFPVILSRVDGEGPPDLCAHRASAGRSRSAVAGVVGRREPPLWYFARQPPYQSGGCHRPAAPRHRTPRSR